MMIELKNDRLHFSFPEVHSRARGAVHFQRTLRIPDDGRRYPLPPGLGAFPLRHVDDFAERVPEEWIRHGGVMLPMFQSEALWIAFVGGAYPMAIKVATGKICAVSGERWAEGLRSKQQNYVVTPGQPWLDGYCVKKGEIRQFVAMPLGSGYTAEEQVTGEAEFGGIQIQMMPMKAEVYEKIERRQARVRYSAMPSLSMTRSSPLWGAGPDMGLAPGGRMKQKIYDDPHGVSAWDTARARRCFVHISNSLVWRHITGSPPPGVPPTAREYSDEGLPWFDYYGGDLSAKGGSDVLAALDSVVELGRAKGEVSLSENETAEVGQVIGLRAGLAKGQVREGSF